MALANVIYFFTVAALFASNDGRMVFQLVPRRPNQGMSVADVIFTTSAPLHGRILHPHPVAHSKHVRYRGKVYKGKYGRPVEHKYYKGGPPPAMNLVTSYKKYHTPRPAQYLPTNTPYDYPYKPQYDYSVPKPEPYGSYDRDKGTGGATSHVTFTKGNVEGSQLSGPFTGKNTYSVHSNYKTAPKHNHNFNSPQKGSHQRKPQTGGSGSHFHKATSGHHSGTYQTSSQAHSSSHSKKTGWSKSPVKHVDSGPRTQVNSTRASNMAWRQNFNSVNLSSISDGGVGVKGEKKTPIRFANYLNLTTHDRVEFRAEGLDGPQSYKFGYDTKGDNRQFRFEERDPTGKVRGHYGYVDDEGTLQITKYEADPSLGFHAEPVQSLN